MIYINIDYWNDEQNSITHICRGNRNDMPSARKKSGRELKFEQIKRTLNNRVTEKCPSLENVMLGRDMKPFPNIEPFQSGDDPEVKSHNAIVSGMISQRVKDQAERDKAIVTTKASILTWLHESFEDYISSSAEPTRRTDWDNND